MEADRSTSTVHQSSRRCIGSVQPGAQWLRARLRFRKSPKDSPPFRVFACASGHKWPPRPSPGQPGPSPNATSGMHWEAWIPKDQAARIPRGGMRLGAGRHAGPACMPTGPCNTRHGRLPRGFGPGAGDGNEPGARRTATCDARAAATGLRARCVTPGRKAGPEVIPAPGIDPGGCMGPLGCGNAPYGQVRKDLAASAPTTTPRGPARVPGPWRQGPGRIPPQGGAAQRVGIRKVRSWSARAATSCPQGDLKGTRTASTVVHGGRPTGQPVGRASRASATACGRDAG